MSTKHNDCKIEIEIKHLIKETDAAAQRTRWTTIVLILATVIIGIGFYNSTDWSFTHERLKALSSFENTPVNNFADNSKPLLDSYFGENDFNNTQFPVGFLESSQEKEFKGLKDFVCKDIYNSIEPDPNEKSIVPHPALGKYLYNSFNSTTQSLLKKECEAYRKNPNDITNSVFENDINFRFLTNDLNRILGDKYLYSEQRFDFPFLDQEPDQLKNIEELRNIFESWVVKNEEGKLNTNANTNTVSKEVSNANKNTSNKANVSNNSTSENNNSQSNKSESNRSELEILRKDVDIVRLNRLLLEAAFPGEILPSTDIIPSHESIMAKEFSKHFAFDDNVQFIEMPFFGNAIDVNDLGIVGGISLIIILLLLRFSLSREIKNLNFSFKQAFYHGKLDQFYHSLAMRQVLTVPEMAGETKNQTLSASSKWVCLLPSVVIFLGVFYDYYSIYHYGVYEPKFVLSHLIAETVCLVIILYLSLRCLERKVHIDDIWKDYDAIINYYKEKNPLPEKDKTTDENAKAESFTSECFRVIKENPEELYNKAFKPQSKKDTGNSEISIEEKKAIKIIKERFDTEPDDDGYWIINLFRRRNIARLFPVKWLANLIAGEEANKKDILTLLYFSTGIFIISAIAYWFERSVFHQNLVIEGFTLIIMTLGAIGALLGGIGNLVTAYVNLKKDKRENTNQLLENDEPPQLTGNTDDTTSNENDTDEPESEDDEKKSNGDESNDS